jgi:hypothetical protein
MELAGSHNYRHSPKASDNADSLFQYYVGLCLEQVIFYLQDLSVIGFFSCVYLITIQNLSDHYTGRYFITLIFIVVI